MGLKMCTTLPCHEKGSLKHSELFSHTDGWSKAKQVNCPREIGCRSSQDKQKASGERSECQHFLMLIKNELSCNLAEVRVRSREWSMSVEAYVNCMWTHMHIWTNQRLGLIFKTLSNLFVIPNGHVANIMDFLYTAAFPHSKLILQQ